MTNELLRSKKGTNVEDRKQKKREKLLITISSKKEKKPLTGPKKLLYSTRQNDGERESFGEWEGYVSGQSK